MSPQTKERKSSQRKKVDYDYVAVKLSEASMKGVRIAVAGQFAIDIWREQNSQKLLYCRQRNVSAGDGTGAMAVVTVMCKASVVT